MQYITNSNTNAHWKFSVHSEVLLVNLYWNRSGSRWVGLIFKWLNCHVGVHVHRLFILLWSGLHIHVTFSVICFGHLNIRLHRTLQQKLLGQHVRRTWKTSRRERTVTRRGVVVLQSVVILEETTPDSVTVWSFWRRQHLTVLLQGVVILEETAPDSIFTRCDHFAGGSTWQYFYKVWSFWRRQHLTVVLQSVVILEGTASNSITTKCCSFWRRQHLTVLLQGVVISEETEPDLYNTRCGHFEGDSFWQYYYKVWSFWRRRQLTVCWAVTLVRLDVFSVLMHDDRHVLGCFCCGAACISSSLSR